METILPKNYYSRKTQFFVEASVGNVDLFKS